MSTQPNPAQQPLSEFFVQLGPENYVLLQLNNGQIVTLRDFKPVSNCYSIFNSLSCSVQILTIKIQTSYHIVIFAIQKCKGSNVNDAFCVDSQAMLVSFVTAGEKTVAAVMSPKNKTVS